MGIIPAGMDFWDPWPTWEKLTFVLGCAILFVFVIGFNVKFHKTRQMRKLEARAAVDLAERGEVTERAGSGTEVPFGIRAIEAGHEVDGIWNSRTATPLQLPSPRSVSEPSSPTVKPLKVQKHRAFGSESSLSKLQLAEPAQVKHLGTTDAPASPTQTDQTIPRKPVQHSAHLTVPEVTITPAPKGRRTIVIGGRTSPQTAAKITPVPTPTTIERMQAHRRQLRAESSQLQRRERRVASAEVSSTSSDCGSDPYRTRSWPSSKSESSATPVSIRHEVVPLPSFVEGGASSRKLPPTSWTQRTGELVDGKLERSKSATSGSTIRLTPENLSHLNENSRKVNDGFEVLPAGSLSKPSRVKEFGLSPEMSIKLVSNKDHRSTRKLQKRNRSSSGSRRSSSDDGLSEKGNHFYSFDSHSRS